MANWASVGRSARRKGSEYERKICGLLTDLTRVKFRRAPRSGALLREGKLDGHYLSGDLISEKEFAFSIECKNRKTINFYSALANPHASEIIKSWHQCVYDASVANKLPLMFFHFGIKDYLVFDERGWALLGEPSDIPLITCKCPFPVKFVIDQKEVVLTLPTMYVLFASHADKLKWNNAFVFRG